MWGTLSERIADKPRLADTVRSVADNPTFGVKSASSWTRILALLVDAG